MVPETCMHAGHFPLRKLAVAASAWVTRPQQPLPPTLPSFWRFCGSPTPAYSLSRPSSSAHGLPLDGMALMDCSTGSHSEAGSDRPVKNAAQYVRGFVLFEHRFFKSAACFDDFLVNLQQPWHQWLAKSAVQSRRCLGPSAHGKMLT